RTARTGQRSGISRLQNNRPATKNVITSNMSTGQLSPDRNIDRPPQTDQHSSGRAFWKILTLFNGECGVCRRIAHWVQKSALSASDQTSIIELPIGDDPNVLRSLNPDLDIWDAYATIHVLMPDGSMKLGGEAVAETLRNLPGTKWFAWSFATTILGFRPFQLVLNVAYAILSDVRPLFGCESC